MLPGVTRITTQQYLQDTGSSDRGFLLSSWCIEGVSAAVGIVVLWNAARGTTTNSKQLPNRSPLDERIKRRRSTKGKNNSDFLRTKQSSCPLAAVVLLLFFVTKQQRSIWGKTSQSINTLPYTRGCIPRYCLYALNNKNNLNGVNLQELLWLYINKIVNIFHVHQVKWNFAKVDEKCSED